MSTTPSIITAIGILLPETCFKIIAEQESGKTLTQKQTN